MDALLQGTGTFATCPRCGMQFEVTQKKRSHWIYCRKKELIISSLLLFAAGLALLHDWKLDKDYFLQPGVWQGEMTYLGKKSPFVFVIERAMDGHLTGYMDWVETSPKYRLAIRGTYTGNHLIFEDYAFLERQGTAGLFDEQDVYIKDNEMTGTAKNGRAEFHALKRS